MSTKTGLSLRFVWFVSGLQVIASGCGGDSFRSKAGTAAPVSASRDVLTDSTIKEPVEQSSPGGLIKTNPEPSAIKPNDADSIASTDTPVIVQQGRSGGMTSSEVQAPGDSINLPGSMNTQQDAGANGAANTAGADAGSGATAIPDTTPDSVSTTSAGPDTSTVATAPQTEAEPQAPEQNVNETRLERQERLCATKTHKTRRVRVMVPQNDGATCPWGKGDNFPKNDGKISARIERKFPIDIPKEHVVCGFKAVAKEQLIRYDDHLFVTINNFVVASRADIVSEFGLSDNQFKQYDWLKIRGRQAGDRPAPFCAKGVVCDVPKTESTGRFFFEFNENSSQRLFSSLGQDSPFFKLIITGDNNESRDCQITTDVEFIVDYNFVVE